MQRDEMEKLRKTIKQQEMEIKEQATQVKKREAEIVRLQQEIKSTLQDLGGEKQKMEKQKGNAALQMEGTNNVTGETDFCPICQDDLIMAAKIQLPLCGHFFHTSCFFQYRGKICPVCRTSIREEEEFPPLRRK